jgi:hypothetical protein
VRESTSVRRVTCAKLWGGGRRARRWMDGWADERVCTATDLYAPSCMIVSRVVWGHLQPTSSRVSSRPLWSASMRLRSDHISSRVNGGPMRMACQPRHDRHEDTCEWYTSQQIDVVPIAAQVWLRLRPRGEGLLDCGRCGYGASSHAEDVVLHTLPCLVHPLSLLTLFDASRGDLSCHVSSEKRPKTDVHGTI